VASPLPATTSCDNVLLNFLHNFLCLRNFFCLLCFLRSAPFAARETLERKCSRSFQQKIEYLLSELENEKVVKYSVKKINPSCSSYVS